jgi:hypothetical protein
MNIVLKSRLVRVAACATAVIWMASYGFAAVTPPISHGPTFPPDPWCGKVAHSPAARSGPSSIKVAHGPTFPPDPWSGKLAHGPTFPPDPWCGKVSHSRVSQPAPLSGKVAHGPTFPPDPWCGRA